MVDKSFMDRYLADVVAQDPERLRDWFAPGGVIRWHNSNEEFTVEEYVRANCEYPGNWQGRVELAMDTEEGAVSVAKVWSEEGAFRVVSFYRLAAGKIIRLEEYWGDIGAAPQWRREMGIGRPISL